MIDSIQDKNFKEITSHYNVSSLLWQYVKNAT